MYLLWPAGGTSLHLAPKKALLLLQGEWGKSLGKDNSYYQTNGRLAGEQFALLTIQQIIYFELLCAV